MTPVSAQQEQHFYATLTVPVLSVCMKYGVDPQKCLRDAAQRSGFGKYAIGNNYWGLAGVGTAGEHQLVTLDHTPHSSNNGGMQPRVRSLAVFKTVVDAVQAYCKQEKRNGNP